MANGLPLDRLTLGAGRLDTTLPSLPIDTGVSTGRAADLSGRQATTLPGGNVINLPGAEDIRLNREEGTRRQEEDESRRELILNIIGGVAGKPTMGTEALAAKRRAGLEQMKMQLEIVKFAREGTTQAAQAFQTYANTLKTVAEASGSATPEQMETLRKGLEKDAAASGMPILARNLIRPMLARPNLAATFPDLLPFMAPGLAQALGPRMVEKPELAWTAAVANIQGTLDQRTSQVVAALKASGKFKEGEAIPFDLVASLVTGGNRALEDYMHGRLPKEAAEQTKSAREGYEARLAAAGVALPSTAAKAQEAGATTAATERAKLEPDIVKKGVAKRMVELQAEEITKATPEMLAATKRRETAVAEAKAQVEMKYRGTGPLTVQEVGAIRDDYTKASATFITSRDAYARMESASGRTTSASDITRLYAYIKMQDPNAVREGELALAQGTGGVLDKAKNLYNQLLQGTATLTPQMRRNFETEAREMFRDQLKSQLALEADYKGIARKRKVDPDEVVPSSVLGRFRDPGKIPSPPKAESLSRTSATYKKARAKGLTDEQIEGEYNIRLSD